MSRRFLRQVFGLPLVIGILWIGVVWYPTNRSEGTLALELATLDRQSSVQLDRLSSLRLIADNHDELVLRQSTLDEAIPPVGEVGPVLAALDAAAQEWGLSIENLTPSRFVTSQSAEPEVALPEGITSISLRLVGSGSYGAVLDFVDAVTSMPRLLLVDDVSLFARAHQDGALSMTLDIRIFTSGTAADGDSSPDERPSALAFDQTPSVGGAPFATTPERPPPWVQLGQRRNPFVRPTAKSDRELLHEDAADGVPSAE